MHLFSTLASAAIVSSAVAANVPVGSNYTFVPHPTASSKPHNLVEEAASSNALSVAQVQALVELSASFKFEVRGGLCAITNLPVKGPAPAPIPADKFKVVTPAGPTQAAKEPQKSALTKPAAGAGRAVAALNVLAGVVALAFFL